eukprot:5640758-Prymnesium_polylepis.1
MELRALRLRSSHLMGGKRAAEPPGGSPRSLMRHPARIDHEGWADALAPALGLPSWARVYLRVAHGTIRMQPG